MKNIFTYLSLFIAVMLSFCFMACTDDDEVISAPTKSAPNAVGDVVLKDGTAISGANVLKMSSSQKSAAVAVIFYASKDSDAALGAKMLGVGVRTSYDDTVTTMKWALSTANGYNVFITPIICNQETSGDILKGTYTYSYSGDTDGSDNFAALKKFLTETADLSDDTGTSGNYPAFEWANSYAENHSLPSEWTDGWYLPSVAELHYVFYENSTKLDSTLKTLGSKGLPLLGTYWSSSQVYQSDAFVSDKKSAFEGSCSSSFTGYASKTESYYVLVIREFDLPEE